MFPIERLENERHRVAPSSAENDRANRHADAIFHMRIEHRIVLHRCRKTGIRVRRFIFGIGRPIVATPIDRMLRRGAVLAFPPSVAVISQRDIRIERVVLDRFHGVRV